MEKEKLIKLISNNDPYLRKLRIIIGNDYSLISHLALVMRDNTAVIKVDFILKSGGYETWAGWVGSKHHVQYIEQKVMLNRQNAAVNILKRNNSLSLMSAQTIVGLCANDKNYKAEFGSQKKKVLPDELVRMLHYVHDDSVEIKL